MSEWRVIRPERLSHISERVFLALCWCEGDFAPAIGPVAPRFHSSKWWRLAWAIDHKVEHTDFSVSGVNGR